MKNIVELGDGVKLDVTQLINSRLLVQANSGGGKSWCLRRLLEQTHGRVQQIILDLEGEFSTLREKFDYLLVGSVKQGADIPVSIRTAELLARKVLEIGVSTIIDLYELKAHERILFVKRFLDAMVNAPKELWHPTLVFVDEAHVFCPEQGKSEAMGSVIDLCTRGRKRGYCAVLATQRLSKLHKDAAAECNNKLIGRSALDVDMKRAADELGITSKEERLMLRQLDKGEFFAFGPAISNQVRRVKIGKVSTTHPEAGSRQALVAPPAPSKVKAMLSKLSDLPREVDEELRTLQDYKNKIHELKMQLRTQPEKVVQKTVIDQVAIEKARQAAFKEAERAFLKQAKELGASAASFKQILEQVAKISSKCLGIEIPKIKAGLGNEVPKPITNFVPISTKSVVPGGETQNGEVSRPQMSILQSLAKLKALGTESVPRPMVAALSGASPRSSAYHNNVYKLRSLGLIDYQNKNLVLTEQGALVAGEVDVPSSDEELQRGWMNVCSEPQARILRVLIEVHPECLERQELAERAGASPTSSAFHNNVYALHSMGAIEYGPNRTVKASKLLFLEVI